MYLLTDCQDKFRGISDILLVVSFVCSLFAFYFFFVAVASSSAIAQYASLLSNMAAHRSRTDANILVLEVSADRTRRFLAEEEQNGAEINVQTSRSGCLQCVRVWYFLYLAVVLAIGVYFAGFAFFATRAACFAIGFVLIFVLLAIYGRICRTKAYLDHQKNKKNRQWAQTLEGPQQLLLFYNVPNLMEGANPGGVAANSVIAFGNGQLGGESCAFFEATREATPGAVMKTTHTRILAAQGQTGDVLEFKTVVERQNPGVFGADVRAEAVARMPLEAHHVVQVREWLRERQGIFQFEIAPDVELQQP